MNYLTDKMSKNHDKPKNKSSAAQSQLLRVLVWKKKTKTKPFNLARYETNSTSLYRSTKVRMKPIISVVIVVNNEQTILVFASDILTNC